MSTKLLSQFIKVHKNQYFQRLESIFLNHSRKSLLFNQEQTWMTKGSDLFDVSMGAYDDDEMYEFC